MEYSFLEVNLSDEKHCEQLIMLLDFYMKDEMGNGKPMQEELAPKIIEGLKNHVAYLGFFAIVDGDYVALANCNKNYSTFKAAPLINIHDFVVHPAYRGKGIGKLFLDSMAEYAKENGYCRINLEVRDDNINAQKLYKKSGYANCKPSMFFWEKKL